MIQGYLPQLTIVRTRMPLQRIDLIPVVHVKLSYNHFHSKRQERSEENGFVSEVQLRTPTLADHGETPFGSLLT